MESGRFWWIRKQYRSEVVMTDLDPRTNTEDRIQPGGDTKEISIGTQPSHITKIGGALKPDEEELLGAVILENRDLFAWSSLTCRASILT